MALNLGTVRPGTTIYVYFDTFAGATGASITMTGLAVGDILIYKDGGTTQRASTTGYTLLDTDGIDFDALTGIHGFSVDLSSDATADFFKAGSQYTIVVSTITVDGQTVSFVAAFFRIGYENAIFNTSIATLASQTSFTLTTGPAEDDALNGCTVLIHNKASAVQVGKAIVNDYTGSTKTVTLVAGVTFTAAAGDNIAILQPLLQPTVWGRTVDVTATGAAGVDWGNVENPTTTLGLTNTTVGVVTLTNTITTYTGNTPQTGDSFARLGAPAGASVSADIAAIEAQTDDIGVAGAGLTAIPAGGVNPDVLITTTITGLVSQTLWALTAGSADDNAYNGCRFVITDSVTAVQKCVGVVNIYSGAGKTMSPLNDPAIFTIADGDTISIMADRAVHPTVDNRNLDVNATGGAGLDWNNIDNKTATVALTNTTVGIVTLVNGLAAGVITATAIATDAIGSDEIAATAATEIATAVWASATRTLSALGFVLGAGDLAADTIGSSELSAAAIAKIADAVLRRNVSNIEGSSDGDSLALGSLYGLVQAILEWAISGTTLTIYKNDGVTSLGTKTVTPAAGADPISGVA